MSPIVTKRLINHFSRTNAERLENLLFVPYLLILLLPLTVQRLRSEWQ